MMNIVTFAAVNLVTLVSQQETRKQNVLLFTHSRHVRVQLRSLVTPIGRHHVTILSNASFPPSSCDRLAATPSFVFISTAE
jgi:hypothetical protein